MEKGRKLKNKDSDDSFDSPKQANINEMIEQGKRQIYRLRNIDKKFLHPETKELSDVLVNAIKEMEEFESDDPKEEEKDMKKAPSESDLDNLSNADNQKQKEAEDPLKVKDSEDDKHRSRKDKFSQSKRNQVDPFYQEQIEEVEKIKKGLTNKDIHLDMKIIRRAVLMPMFGGQ